MNNIEKYLSLKNQYFVIRHGQSLANIDGIVVSRPENGVPNYGLSALGKQQVAESIVLTGLSSSTRIISSDFKRAEETAQIAHNLLQSNYDLELDISLRERDFGEFELLTDKSYQIPWGHDATDSSHTFDNVESADSVMDRVTALISNLEENNSAACFLLVAHGDTLQILQTAFLRLSASKQRTMPHLNNAEIRELRLVAC